MRHSLTIFCCQNEYNLQCVNFLFHRFNSALLGKGVFGGEGLQKIIDVMEAKVSLAFFGEKVCQGGALHKPAYQ